MAVQGQEVEVLGPGISGDSPLKGSFAMNMIKRYGGWNVRRGFGQLTELDTTLSCNSRAAGGPHDFGLVQHLGSHLMRTDFDHIQIISVFHNMAYTGSTERRGEFVDLYSVVIYDVTTGDSWEEVLHHHTSEFDPEITPPLDMHGLYATNNNDRFEKWCLAANIEHFGFTEYDDFLFFGSKDVGTFIYIPAVFASSRDRVDTFFRHRQTDVIDNHDWAPGYEESSMVTRMVPSQGVETDYYAYLTPSDFPTTSLTASVLGRMAYISPEDRIVWFSDIQFPTSIAADNWVYVPAERPLTAVAELNGSLFVFSETETFLYQPSDGFLASGGTLVPLSSRVGCLSMAALTHNESNLVWLDARGVYTSNGMEIQVLSNDIDQFFSNYLSNPMSNYYQQDGDVALSRPQPKSTWKFRPEGVNLVYHPDLDALFVSVPEENIVLCLSEGAWSVWNLQSIANATASPVVHAVDYITNGLLLSDGNRLFLVGSVLLVTVEDDAMEGGQDAGGAGPDVDDDIISRSFYLLEYGRGGSLDRNVEDEDERIVGGKYVEASAAQSDMHGAIYFDKPVNVPERWVFTNGQVITGVETRLLPIEVALREDVGPPIGAFPVSEWHIEFEYDNTAWRPVLIPGTTEVDIILPPERQASLAGYAQGAPAGGVSEVQVYDANTGAPDAAGNEIRIHWSGALGAHTWTPNANLTARSRNRIMWVPFYRLNTTEDYSGLGVVVTLAAFNAAPNNFLPKVFIWEESSLGDGRIGENLVAQAVDWCYKSDALGIAQAQRIRCRGVYITLHTTGEGDNLHEPNWEHGLLNMVVSSDWRSWSTQLLDHAGDSPDISLVTTKEPLRARLLSDAGTLVHRKFNADIRYAGGAPTALYLIDDPEVNDINLSESTKGQWVSVMLFGHVRDRAATLRLESVKAELRVHPGRRRRSH